MNTPDTECGCTRTKYCEKHFNESVHKSHPTPDTEWKDELDTLLTDSELPIKELEYRTLRGNLETLISSLLSSRDTYWKERVRKEVEGMPNATRDECYNEKVICADDLLQALDNLK